MMSIQSIFWNCRGVRKRGVASYVEDKMRDLKLDTICFQEIILHDFSEACLRKIDPNKEYLWDWIPAQGRSGGVLTGIKSERFDVGIRIQGDFILQHTL
jgi:exonuclease III